MKLLFYVTYYAVCYRLLFYETQIVILRDLLFCVTDLMDLKELIIEAEEKKFPDSPLMQTLVSSVSEAEKCASVANQLVSKKVRTRCVAISQTIMHQASLLFNETFIMMSSCDLDHVHVLRMVILNLT